MKKKFALVVLLSMTAYLSLAAGKKRGFEWTLSVWTETLSWTEDKGFHLTFRSWNKPLLAIQRDDGSYDYINSVGADVYLQRGKRYMLTNGRKAIYDYDEMGNLQWQIELTGTKVDEFWRVENGRIEESSDLELAQKLAEQETIEDVE